MTTKTVSLRTIDLMPGLSLDTDGIPFRWLTSMVTKVQALVPDDEEGTCRVHGAAGLRFTYEHKLTEAEEQAEKIAELAALVQRIKESLPREGALSGEQADQLRELLR